MSNYNNDRLIELESRLAVAERERDELIGMREEVLHYQREFHRLRDERDEAVGLLREAFDVIDPDKFDLMDDFVSIKRRIDAFLAKLEAK